MKTLKSIRILYLCLILMLLLVACAGKEGNSSKKATPTANHQAQASLTSHPTNVPPPTDVPPTKPHNA